MPKLLFWATGPRRRRASALAQPLAALALAALIVAAPLAASANAKARYREQIDQFRVMLDEMSKLDLQDLAASDRADIIKWLEEADVLLARGDLDRTGAHLKRAEYGLEMVRQITLVSQLQGQAQQQEQTFHAASEELTKLTDEIGKLTAQKASLERELTSLNP